MTHSSPIRLLLADDHAALLEGLAAVLVQEGFVIVGMANTGQDAVELILKERPDLALIDLRLPDISGIECLKQVSADWPQAKIAFLSTFDFPEDVSLGFQAGACGYLVKSITRPELVEAIHDMHGGKLSVSPGVCATLAVANSRLTSREKQVLQLLAVGQTNRKIASELFITEGTVKLHIYNLYQKLGVRNRTEAVQAGRKCGLIS